MNDRAQIHIKSMRLLIKELDVFQCQPDIGYRLLNNRGEDEAYLIYETNKQYAVFFPNGGTIGPGVWPLFCLRRKP